MEWQDWNQNEDQTQMKPQNEDFICQSCTERLETMKETAKAKCSWAEYNPKIGERMSSEGQQLLTRDLIR